jgi:hypothetical protein
MPNKKFIKVSLIAFGFVLIGLQFIPSKANQGQIYSPDYLANTVQLNPKVEQIFKSACFDCHSNHTNYLWYSNVQPIGFWIEHHINEGKEELNFSQFANYSKKKQIHKLEECIEMLEEDEMPLFSYRIIHQEAELNHEEKQLLIQSLKSMIQEIQSK